MNGYSCRFCHYEHEKRKRKTKTNKKVAATSSSAPAAVRTMLASGFVPSTCQLSHMSPSQLAGLSMMTPALPGAVSLQPLGAAGVPGLACNVSGGSALPVLQQQACTMAAGMQVLPFLGAGSCVVQQQPMLVAMQASQHLIGGARPCA